MKKVFILLLATAAAFISCGDRFLIDDIARTPKKRVDIALTKAQQEIVPSTRSFTFDLMRVVASHEKGNVFVSPFSLQTALSMASVGASGQTCDEINKTIGFDGFLSSDVASFYKTIIPALADVDNVVNLAIANSLWVNEDYKVKDTYRNTLEKDFHASVHPLGVNSRQDINKWVNKSTKGMIKNLGVNVDDAAMLLINAMYFKGIWANPFERKNNSIDAFLDYSGKSSQVEFMNQTLKCTYFNGDVASSVSLPYGNGAYNMTIVIPTDERSSIDDVLALLNEESWNDMIDSRTFGPVELSMPKFETEYNISFNNALESMGISRAFSEDAEFDEMTESSVRISEICQQSKIKVDEKGTEAAAVSHVVFGATSAGPGREAFRFKVDTPFFYAISEVSTGTILFAGVQKWM